jgi:hypothetical protein
MLLPPVWSIGLDLASHPLKGMAAFLVGMLPRGDRLSVVVRHSPLSYTPSFFLVLLAVSAAVGGLPSRKRSPPIPLARSWLHWT